MKFVTLILMNEQKELLKNLSGPVELSHSFDSPDLILANFLLFHKGKHTKRRCLDVKDIKKNVKTELNAVSLDAFSGCCVQLLYI